MNPYGMDPAAYSAFVFSTFNALMWAAIGLGGVVAAFFLRREDNRLALASAAFGVAILFAVSGPTVHAMSVMTGCQTAPDWLYILAFCWMP